MPTIEALDKRFDQQLALYEMKLSVVDESVLDLPSTIWSFFKRCILMIDDYAKGIIDIMHEKTRQREVSYYLHAVESYKDYFNKNPIWHRYCSKMETKDPQYFSELVLSMSRLMYTETKYLDMDKYVKDYLEDLSGSVEGSDIVTVSYDDLCEYVKECMEASEKRIQDIKSGMKNFSKAWERTRTESLSQTLLAKLTKMAKSAIKEIAVTTMYNISSFRLYTCKMFTQSISEEEHKAVQNYDRLSARKKENLEKKSTVVGTHQFGDVTITVHELPVTSATAYNRNGTDVYVDQMFKEYPKAIQKAIIYHEIGHLANGHFGTLNASNDTVDARRLAHQIKKYKQMVAHSAFKDYMDDEELVYIMIESEADRYAAKFVGKKTVDVSLKIRMDRRLAASIPKDINNVTDMEFSQIAYNQERNRFRAALG